MPEPKDTAAHVKELVSAPKPVAENPFPVAEPPAVEPHVVLIEVQGTIFSKGGNNSVSFRAPNSAVFSSPDAAIVITNLLQTPFDLLRMGQLYKIEISTIP